MASGLVICSKPADKVGLNPPEEEFILNQATPPLFLGINCPSTVANNNTASTIVAAQVSPAGMLPEKKKIEESFHNYDSSGVGEFWGV